ncbi:linear amide C-N hydrolase [Orrella marina]|nr:linear amide C-N hydrolase [Orrella marina]
MSLCLRQPLEDHVIDWAGAAAHFLDQEYERMCTSLIYRDASNRPYLGRTLELSVDLPYQVSFVPQQMAMSSKVGDQPALTWQNNHAFIAVTMPAAVPANGSPLDSTILKVVEGVNDAGLTFSVQAYSQAGGPQPGLKEDQIALSAADLGAYVLGNHATVADVKEALAALPVILERVPILGGLEMPFHYVVHDVSGASLVIEFHHGVRTLYDNPVGVMTNAPPFSWHLVNLNNYTFLSNVDRSTSQFMDYKAIAPGSGIAKAGLPASDNSVDRFIRAAYYAHYAEKQADPDKAVQMVAHIMNNFDRPRGITIDPPDVGSGHMQIEGHEGDAIPTEFTTWTSVTDLNRRHFYLRDSGGMRYVQIALNNIKDANKFRTLPMSALMSPVADVTEMF